MTLPINRTPYLRTSREFPGDIDALVDELSKAYIDTANVVNDRVIGIYPKNRPAVNGKSFYINSQKQQGLQQIYTFTATGNIAHNLSFNEIATFTNCYGSYTDGTNFYGLPFASSTAIAGQNSFYITSSNIVVIAGAGAPVITSGIVILEWISDP
jgi:hypothetical protein